MLSVLLVFPPVLPSVLLSEGAVEMSEALPCAVPSEIVSVLSAEAWGAVVSEDGALVSAVADSVVVSGITNVPEPLSVVGLDGVSGVSVSESLPRIRPQTVHSVYLTPFSVIGSLAV